MSKFWDTSPYVFLCTGSSKKTLLSSVTHVSSGLMGCASAALGRWVGGRREIQTCKKFFAPRCMSQVEQRNQLGLFIHDELKFAPQKEKKIQKSILKWPQV